MTVHEPGSAASPPEESFLFSPASLALFTVGTWAFLALTYGVAAPTGALHFNQKRWWNFTF